MPYPNVNVLEGRPHSDSSQPQLEQDSSVLEYYERAGVFLHVGQQSPYGDETRFLFGQNDKIPTHESVTTSQRRSRSRSVSSFDSQANERLNTGLTRGNKYLTLPSLTFLQPDFPERFGTSSFYSQLAKHHLRASSSATASGSGKGRQRDFSFATTISLDYLNWEIKNEIRDIERTETTDHEQLSRIRELLIVIKQIYGRGALNDIPEMSPSRHDFRRVFTPNSQTTRDMSEIRRESIPGTPTHSSRASSPTRRSNSWGEIMRTWNLLRTLADFGADVAGSVTLIPYFIFLGAYSLLKETGIYITETRLWRIIRQLLSKKTIKAAALPYILLVWFRQLFDD